MELDTYHQEWRDRIEGKEGPNVLKFLLEHVVMPVLERNSLYNKRAGLAGVNSGFGMVLQDVKEYLAGKGELSPTQIHLFGETAYTLWLLGDRLQATHEAIVQKRINEFFKGEGYYESGLPGYRQFEYELQTICRFAEEGIPVAENEGENEPDLSVSSAVNQFSLEVKLPTANVMKSLKKAVSQIGLRTGIVIIGLDIILYEVPTTVKRAKVCEIASSVDVYLKTLNNLAVVFEFYPDSEGVRQSELCWTGQPIDLTPVSEVLGALAGQELPPSVLGGKRCC
jgi:hypothetical protein